jgi:MOB kinase activator 1
MSYTVLIVVDFFNGLSLIWGIVMETEMPSFGAGDGFPAGFEYLWADGVVIRTPIKCSSTEYVEYVMNWVEDQINNEAIFPSSSGNIILLYLIYCKLINIIVYVDSPFPRNYLSIVKQIFTRMFRIFAIIYSQHFSRLEQLGAAAHLNTSFKHYMFFVWEYDLIDPREFGAAQVIVDELRTQYVGYGGSNGTSNYNGKK